MEHRPHVHGDALARALLVVIGRSAPQLGRFGGAEAGGDVAMERVVRGRLIGHDVGRKPASHQRRENLRAIAHKGHRERLAAALCVRAPSQRLVERRRRTIDVARFQTALDAGRIRFDRKADPFIHGRGEGLRTTHAAESPGQHDPPAQRSLKVSRRDGGKGLVRSLENPLCADVDPRPRGHLAVHDQPAPLEIAKHVPRREATHEIGVRDQHARGIRVCREHPHRLARLHEQRLVVFQHAQRPADRVERGPIPRRFARPAVHHEVVGSLRDLGVEVVHQHPQGSFLDPSLAGFRCPARGFHEANLPSRMRAATFSMSAVSGRSAVSAADSCRTAAYSRPTALAGRNGFR